MDRLQHGLDQRGLAHRACVGAVIDVLDHVRKRPAGWVADESHRIPSLLRFRRKRGQAVTDEQDCRTEARDDRRGYGEIVGLAFSTVAVLKTQ
jgi:hypothetical protein